jgi:hypothetical protein
MEAEGVMTFFLQQLKPSSQPSSAKDEVGCMLLFTYFKIEIPEE